MRIKQNCFLFLVFVLFSATLFAERTDSSHVKWDFNIPGFTMQDTWFKVQMECHTDLDADEVAKRFPEVEVNGEKYVLEYDGYKAIARVRVTDNSGEYKFKIGGQTWEGKLKVIPLWTSVVPPLIAIVLALVFREVITSLFIGILSGAWIISINSEGLGGIFSGFLNVMDRYIMDALNNWSHIAVIIFSMMIAGVVSIISKNGGMRGVVNLLEPYAHNRRSGQFVIWLMGVLIFFDDYANTLVVGNTMRPVADRLKISREKLAYLVDSTAAPVAAVAFITTWIGAELGYIESGLVEIEQMHLSPYSVFLNSLAYAFYPLLTLTFMLILIYKQRDYGPMLRAENDMIKGIDVLPKESDKSDELSREFTMKEGVKPRAINAIIPILIIIFGAVWGMWTTGYSDEVWNDATYSFTRKISIIIGNSDSFTALLWSSMAGAVVAIIMSVSQRILKLGESISSGLEGFKTMIPAMSILVLAWSLAVITEHMHTAVFLQSLWSDSLSPVLLPAVVFGLSALVSFSTGSSWGTMAILYPLMLPASYHISIEAGLPHEEAMIIFYNVVSVVLAGSVFGDHCSPISDTTILSSLASSCNHIDHVRTQLPYALTVGFIATTFGTLPASMGVSPLILFPVNIVLLYLVIQFLGKRSAVRTST